MAPEAISAETIAALARWAPPMAPEATLAETMAALAIWSAPACLLMKPPVTLS